MGKRFVFSFSLRLTTLALLFSAATCAQETATVPLPEGQIREAAAHILKKAGKANCKSNDCKIAVANFIFSSGLTSRFAMDLADQFSKELASQQNSIRVIDRSQIRSDLERQRIPGALLNNEKAIRWLGRAMGATAVLTGALEEKGASFHLKVRLLSCWKDKAGPDQSLTFSYSGPASDLSQAEAFAPQLSSTNSSDPGVRQAGVGGVGQPTCVYCPNPIYTNAAREAKFSGLVLLQVVVSAAGRAAQVWVLRGLPFGLNEASINTVRNWKFKPAALNGKPVTAMVTIEVTFNIR